MIVPFTSREIEIILQWRSEMEDWPDERRVLRKLRAAFENHQPPDLSCLQLQILRGWAEEQTGGHFGGGLVTNIDEKKILEKVDSALL